MNVFDTVARINELSELLELTKFEVTLESDVRIEPTDVRVSMRLGPRDLDVPVKFTAASVAFGEGDTLTILLPLKITLE